MLMEIIKKKFNEYFQTKKNFITLYVNCHRCVIFVTNETILS